MEIIFKTADLVRCVDHSLDSTKWNMGYEEELEPSPALLLVHDNGVYIMSNGNPGDWIPEKDICYVAYAKDCNPHADENFYENSRNLVGGDDFIEVLPIQEDWKTHMLNYEELHIIVNENVIEAYFAVPKAA